jgi:hypothetical protein
VALHQEPVKVELLAVVEGQYGFVLKEDVDVKVG